MCLLTNSSAIPDTQCNALHKIGSETQQRFATLQEEGILVSIVSLPSEEAIRSQKGRCLRRTLPTHFVITPPAQLKELAALMLLSNPSMKPAAKRDMSSTQDDLKRVYTRQDYIAGLA